MSHIEHATATAITPPEDRPPERVYVALDVLRCTSPDTKPDALTREAALNVIRDYLKGKDDGQ